MRNIAGGTSKCITRARHFREWIFYLSNLVNPQAQRIEDHSNSSLWKSVSDGDKDGSDDDGSSGRRHRDDGPVWRTIIVECRWCRCHHRRRRHRHHHHRRCRHHRWFAIVLALRTRRAVVSGAHRVHMYTTYLSPFSEINKQCRGYSCRAPTEKVVPCLMFPSSPVWLRAFSPTPSLPPLPLTLRCLDCPIWLHEAWSRVARRTSKCQSVSKVDSLPSHRRGLAFSDRKCSVLSEPLLFSRSPFLLVLFEGRFNETSSNSSTFKFRPRVPFSARLSPCINRYLVRHRGIPRYRSSVHVALGSTSCSHLGSNRCQPAHGRISCRLLIAISVFLHLSYSELLRSFVVFRTVQISFSHFQLQHILLQQNYLYLFLQFRSVLSDPRNFISIFHNDMLFMIELSN